MSVDQREGVRLARELFVRFRPLIILIFGSIGVALISWYVDSRQTDMAEKFSYMLMKNSSELQLTRVDFTDDLTMVYFEVSTDKYLDTESAEYVRSLGAAIKETYCSVVAGHEIDLGLEAFNVNVRAIRGARSKIILSQSLSQKSCF